MTAARRRRPRQARSRMLVESIVEGAIDLLQRRREPQMKVREIARRAGVGVGSIYEYFEGRDGIFNAVFERLMRQNFDDLIARWEAHAELPIEDAAVALADDALELYLSRPALTWVSAYTAVRMGKMGLVTEERDRFCTVAAERFLREGSTLERAEIERIGCAAMDAMMGVIMSELHRPPDPERERGARDFVRRLMRAEARRMMGQGG